MFQLDLSRWGRVWLSRPWKLGSDPGTGMLELHGVRGYLVPDDVVYLFNLTAVLPIKQCRSFPPYARALLTGSPLFFPHSSG